MKKLLRSLRIPSARVQKSSLGIESDCAKLSKFGISAWICGLILATNSLYGDEKTTLPTVNTTMAAMQKLDWKPRAPGVWSAIIGKPEMGSMEFAGPPQTEALKVLGNPEFPQALAGLSLGDVQGVYTSIRLPLSAEERIYGLGMRADGNVDLRSKTFQLRITPTSHAPTPFYISSAGYGVVFNTARVLNIQVGIGNRKDSPNVPEEIDRTTDKRWSSRPHSDAVEANVVGTGLEVFVFAGHNPLEVVQRYNLYCGGGCMPPRWGLGVWQRVHTETTAEQAIAEVEEFEKRDMPLDVLGLEPGWQSAAYPCTYEWDAKRFSDPAGFMKTMLGKGISVNLWENLFISKKSPIFKPLESFAGSHLYWLGYVPDYTFKKALDIFMTYHRKSHLDLGISGYKVDEVDELSTEHMLFPSGLCGEQMRQIQGILIQKAYQDVFRQMNRRTCGLVRGSNVGGSSYPFALYSDTYAHLGFIQALTNSSLSGVLWCSEVRDAKSDEDWVRRFQTALFSPVMQLNGWMSGAKPWSRPNVADQVRDLLKLRTQWVPYLYTAMADYRCYGTPPVRHMILEEGYTLKSEVIPGKLDGQTNPYAEATKVEMSDQFMFGPSLLVAPMIAGSTSRTIVLPKGKWYDYYTGKLAGDGVKITMECPLDRIPLLVKDGGIIALMAPVNNVRLAVNSTALEVRHYGEKEGSYQLYDDDGETFDYERGVFSRQELRVVRVAGQLKGEACPAVGPWKSHYTAFNWKFMTPTGQE